MNLLKGVQVRNFWGHHDISIDFYSDVNFIIGINGSGKTTLVNLIVASLKGDLEELLKIDFDAIQLKLRGIGTRRQPVINIVKEGFTISYDIKDSSKSDSINFTFDILEDTRFTFARRESFRKTRSYLSDELSRYIELSWLSVNRAKYDPNRDSREKIISGIDPRLEQLSNDLVRYFSFISKKVGERVDHFQKIVFLSLLFKKDKPENLLRISAEQQRKALEGIFQQFSVTKKDDLDTRLDSHVIGVNKAKEKLIEGTGLKFQEASILANAERIDHIVNEWNKHLDDKKLIEEPKENFLRIINSMMQRKKFSINLHNELVITTQSGKSLNLNDLSSGEKQLLIVLGEALLQEKKNCIYFADEPEISLHVKWQESLVEHLRSINPNAQIIFATHSPDVVSIFNDKVFDMEKLF